MKKYVIAFSIIAVVFAAGCIGTGETCESYCSDKPHAMCTGHWNITGEYPDCNCEWVCDTSEQLEPAEYCQENGGRIVQGPEASGKVSYCLFEESYCRAEDFQKGDCTKGENFYECKAETTESEGYYDNETGVLISWYNCAEPAQMPNPAAQYCEEQNGTVEIREDPRESGGQYGVCILENGTVCDEWAYYEGGCESCITYCEKQPHIMCTGYYNITGEYPDCNCHWVCEEGGPV